MPRPARRYRQRAKDPRAIVPNSWQLNFSVEQQLARNTSLQLGDVGNAGIHLTLMADLNRIPQADWNLSSFLMTNGASNSVTNINQYRPAANFGTIRIVCPGGDASYHSLQALFRSRTVEEPFSFQVSYTYSTPSVILRKRLSGSVNQEAFVDPSNTRLDKGMKINVRISSWPTRCSTATSSKSNHMLQQVIGGWETPQIVSIQSEHH